MKIYKIECEWEMPIAKGYFEYKKDAERAIDNEDWLCLVDMTLKEVVKEGLVSITTINVS